MQGSANSETKQKLYTFFSVETNCKHASTCSRQLILPTHCLCYVCCKWWRVCCDHDLRSVEIHTPTHYLNQIFITFRCIAFIFFMIIITIISYNILSSPTEPCQRGMHHRIHYIIVNTQPACAVSTCYQSVSDVQILLPICTYLI